MIHRNDSKHPLTINGSRRPGQFEWHDACCMIEDYGIKMGTPPHRAIWCATHGQWADESVVRTTYLFQDGTEIVRENKEVKTSSTKPE